MIEKLITRFGLAEDALRTAVEKNLHLSIKYFDDQVNGCFQQIVDFRPSTGNDRLLITHFLLDFACEHCCGERIAMSAKNRILSLVEPG